MRWSYRFQENNDRKTVLRGPPFIEKQWQGVWKFLSNYFDWSKSISGISNDVAVTVFERNAYTIDTNL